MYYAFLFIAALLIAFQFVVGKLYQVKYLEGNESLFFRNIIMSILGLLLFLIITKFKVGYSKNTLIFAIIISLIIVCNNSVQIVVVKYGEIAIFTIFLMLGGMILPYIYGVLFLNETPTIGCIIGIFVLIIAIIISSIEKLKSESKNKVLFVILCFAGFILNGLMSVFSKVSRITSDVLSINEFIIYQQLFSLIFSLIIFLGIKLVNKKKGIKESVIHFEKKNDIFYAFGLIMLFVIISQGGYFLQLIGAEHLPAIVLYPIVSGGSIVFTAILGSIFFKEKLSVVKIISLVLTLIGTLLFMF